MTVETLRPYCETESTRAICAKCGGKCCQTTPGLAWPSDFKPDVEESVRAAVKTGRWVLRQVDGVWVVTPRGKEPNRITYEGYAYWDGGPCTFWSAAGGCALPYKERPRECRMLEPQKNGSCISHAADYDKGARRAWRRYQAFLKQFVEANDEH